MAGARLLAGAWVVFAALVTPTQLFAQAADPGAAVPGLPGAPAADPAAGQQPPADAAPNQDPAASDPSVEVATQSGTTTRSAGAAAGGAVTIKDFSFGPSSITIHAGDTVTWTNQGPSGHSATANGGSFDTGVLSAGTSKSHTFSAPGTFPYHCAPHPFMTATVRVLAANSSDSSSGSSGSSSSGSGSGHSESSAVASPDAGASSSQLASTGFDPLPLTVVGLLLLAAGVAGSGRRPASPGPSH